MQDLKTSIIFSNFSSSSKTNTFYSIQDNTDELVSNKNDFIEVSSGMRMTRFSNALINYDYKTGHYIGNWEQQYPYLYTTFSEVGRGIKKPS